MTHSWQVEDAHEAVSDSKARFSYLDESGIDAQVPRRAIIHDLVSALTTEEY